MLRRHLLIALSLVAAPLMAQEARNTIDPGMTRDEVVQRLGKPLNERTSGTHTYMFYRNGCEKTCGMNDLVVLEEGKVVDAVFRNGVRAYSGASSSPSGVQTANSAAGDASAVAKVRKARRGGIVIARPADDDKPASGDAKPAAAVVTGVQVEPTPMTAQPAPTSPLLGARMNPADSVRALTPGRPTPIPGTKLNSTDSARAEAIKRQQQADSTRKP